jgi:hypothetical protein
MKPTGRSAYGYDEYVVALRIDFVHLNPGKYWLNVTPIGDGTGRSFDSTTSGANAVGSPPGNNGNSFFNSTYFGRNFSDPQVDLGPGTWDFAMGVAGLVSP